MCILHSSLALNVGSRISLDILPSRDCTLVPHKSHFIVVHDSLLNIKTGENDIPFSIPLNPPECCHRNEEVDFARICTDNFVSKGKGDFIGSDAEFPFYQDSKCANSFLRTF